MTNSLEAVEPSQGAISSVTSPLSAPARGRLWLKLNSQFLLLCLLLIVANGPRLRSNFVPRHDTFAVLELFHPAYSNLYFNRSTPEWMPYGFYGMSFDHLALTTFTPATYAAMYAGALLRVENALLVFKIGLLLEQFALLLGTYLLCRLLYRRQLATSVICIAALCTADWTYQLHWNFRIYYLVPLGLYFLFRFFQSGRGALFWIAGIVFILSLIGNVGYFPIPFILFLTVLCFVMVFRNWSILNRLVEPSAVNLASFLAFVVMTGFYLNLLFHSVNSVAVTASGRDRSDLGTSLHTFLNYGGHPSASEFAGLLINGWPIFGKWSGSSDQSIYVGLLPLAMFVWALVRVRSPCFLALAIATVTILWLSLGDIFAASCYYLPGVRYFRHVGLLYAFAKILVLICSGFGLEDFLETARNRDLLVCGLVLLAVCDLFGALHETAALRNKLAGRGGGLVPNLFVVRAAAYLSILGLGIATSYLKHRRARLPGNWWYAPQALTRLGLLLLLAFLFDIGSFNLASYYYHYKPSVMLAKEVFTVERPHFVEQRSDRPTSERARKGLELVQEIRDAMPGDYAFELLQFSPCRSYFYGVLHSQGVAELLAAGKDRAPSNVILALDEQELKKAVDQKEQDHAFLRVVGCEAPRLRLVANAVWVKSAQEAEEAIRQVRDLDQVVVLRDRSGGDVPATPQPSKQSEEGTIKVIAFQPDQLELEADVTNPGGAYLVYANSFHPDWRATVDGSSADILEAYRAFQAVRLEPGNHRIKLAFRDQPFKPARILTLFGAIVGIILFLGGVMLLFYTPANSQSRA